MNITWAVKLSNGTITNVRRDGTLITSRREAREEARQRGGQARRLQETKA